MKKYLPGIAPLIILIAVGILFAGAGGVYVVNKKFIKTGDSGKAALDQNKINQQLANPESQSPPEENNNFTPVTEPYTFEPELNENTANQNVPGFTIDPPTGWGSIGPQTSAEIVVFESPDKDEEPGEDDLIVWATARVTVQIIPETQQTDLVTLGEGLAKQSYNQNEVVEILSQGTTTLNGVETYKIDSTFLNQGVTRRNMDYIFIKDGYWVIVSGASLDSAWSTRSGSIQSSLNSFIFTD